jgi:hypothetical protein
LIADVDDGLDKAAVKYLESCLVQEAREVGLLNLQNGNVPPRPSLSEAGKDSLDQFLDQVLSILPTIRVDGFSRKTRDSTDKSETRTTFQLRTPKHGVVGTAELRNEYFVVLPGSKGRASWEGTPDDSYKKLFEQVLQSGVYVPEGESRRFTKAYAFSSASAAGAVLNGRATNGPAAWYLDSYPRKTYREWEAEQILGG